jgi:glycosyltransferase involved in cell wall biosynthesis
MTRQHQRPLLGVVVIGRNEGERLRVCLSSALKFRVTATLVYVDSGSTDQSVELAKNMGCDVVALDMRVPFTAARARNEGFARAISLVPNLDLVQFVDGDCEIANDWLEYAMDFLAHHDTVAVACGRRRERFPQKSIYNQLCDLEWDSPVGQTKSCGGDAMMRVSALSAVGGYRQSLIAGEEPELCVRLRSNCWKIWRLDCEMTLHDAAMFRIDQWWNRAKRAGHAFAEGAFLHGSRPERHYVPEFRRAVLWGMLIPATIAAWTIWHPAFLLLLFVYPLQVIRLALARQSQGTVAWWRALFLVLGKFPEAQGICRFYFNKLLSKSATLIEYK